MIKRGLPLLFIGAFAWAQVETTLSLDEVLQKISGHAYVVQAALNVKMAESELRSLKGWGDVTLALQPSGELQNQSGSLDVTGVKIGAELSIPLGITNNDKERILILTDLYELRLRELDEAYGHAFLDLFQRYSTLYINQEAVKLAAIELDYQKVHLNVVNQYIERGLLSIGELFNASSAYENAKANLSKAQLDARIAWFNLAYAAGLENPKDEHDPGTRDSFRTLPIVSSPVFDVALIKEELPLTLILSAKKQSSASLKQNQSIRQAQRTLDSYSSLLFNIAPKLGYTESNVSISLGYSSQNGLLSLGTSISPYTATGPSSSLQTSNNALSLSLAITAQLDGEREVQRKLFADALALEYSRLGALEATLELAVRSKYAAYLKAKEAEADTLRSIESVKSLYETYVAKKQLGLASPEDEAADRALLARAQFNYEKARVTLIQAYFELINAASAWHLSPIQPWRM